jgi:protein pelota
LITNRLDVRHGLVTLTPEQPDDLWVLRRIITKGDLVAGETSRVYKETSEYARPDKERIKVTVTIETESIQLDSTLSRLRILGKILDVSNDLLSKGSFHSLTISEGHRVSIRKPAGFTSVQLKLIEGANLPKDSYAVIAIDRREAGMGIVKGTHLQLLPTIESGITGKMYQDSKKSGKDYFDRIADALASIITPSSKIFVLGPSTTKNSFANYVSQNRKDLPVPVVIEGSDVTGEDGVYTALRTPGLQDALGQSRLAKVSKILAEVMRRISLGDNRVSLAFSDSLKAAKQSAVESLVVADSVFSQKNVEEEALVDLLNSVEEYRGETFLLDSSTDLGSQVNSLGGVVGLLRFPLR